MKAKRYYSDPACTQCDGVGFYWKPEADCAECRGTGKDEDSSPCQCCTGPFQCKCHMQQKIRVMTAEARIPGRYLGCTVSNFKPERESERNIRTTVIKWIESYPNFTGKDGLFLYGPPGTGKTHMATAICSALIRRHSVQPLYQSATELSRKIASRIEDKTLTDPFQAPLEAELLVIDDFGAEKVTEYSISLFAELIDYRYRCGMPTLFTSNLDINSLEAIYGGRVADRIHDTCQILHCDGRSRRRETAA